MVAVARSSGLPAAPPRDPSDLPPYFAIWRLLCSVTVGVAAKYDSNPVLELPEPMRLAMFLLEGAWSPLRQLETQVLLEGYSTANGTADGEAGVYRPPAGAASIMSELETAMLGVLGLVRHHPHLQPALNQRCGARDFAWRALRLAQHASLQTSRSPFQAYLATSFLCRTFAAPQDAHAFLAPPLHRAMGAAASGSGKQRPQNGAAVALVDALRGCHAVLQQSAVSATKRHFAAVTFVNAMQVRTLSGKLDFRRPYLAKMSYSFGICSCTYELLARRCERCHHVCLGWHRML